MTEENKGWTDEEKAAVIAEYTEAEPTPENTMDIVKEIADGCGKSSNAIRMILSRADVYVKKSPPTKTEGASSSKRIVKADALKELTETITAVGAEVDEDIIARLTGKAAVYFSGVIKASGQKG